MTVSTAPPTQPQPRPQPGRKSRLPRSRGTLLAWTFLLLLFARLALALLPVRFVFAWKRRPVRIRADQTPEQILWTVKLVAWAVEWTVRHSPVRFVCFPQCLAAVALLRRAGIDSRLHYGVARIDQRLQTHTWLESDGEVLVGGAAARDFSTLGVY